jgi:mannose-1-phosphate guanylyltransferase
MWEFIEPESIDYGLLEKAENIYVIRGKFQWNDVGSWSALYDVFNPNAEGNIIKGNGKIMDGKNNLIQSNGKFTAIIGLSDIVVINTDDATLVVPRDKVETIKDLVTYLTETEQIKLI